MTHETYIKEAGEQFLEELKAFLRIPSVSARAEYHKHVLEAADFLTDQLSKAGMQRIETFLYGGNPIVYAEKMVSEEFPTVLIYGHYDVQPAEPLELWVSPPFSPEIRNGKIYARGACDDKAQVLLVIKALETMFACGTFPCNVKLIIEGEEEIGSVSLETFIIENKALLQTDSFLVCDTSMPDENHPVLITGLRGICYWELSLTVADEDVHSGMFGGIAPNAADVLCRLIGMMKDANGKVLIPGFYGDMDPIDWQNLTEEERLTECPSLDVNGFHSGYIENGPKTVIPAKAFAKISSRLAPGQDYQHVHQCMENYLRENLPEGVCYDLQLLSGHNAVRTQTDTIDYRAAEKALENQFGTFPESKKIGGTIPVVSMMQRHLEVNPLLMGFGLENDNIHAPNERFLVANYYKGMLTLIDFFSRYGAAFEQFKTASTQILA